MVGFAHRVMQSSTECESIAISSESITARDSLCGTIFPMSHLDGPRRFLPGRETLFVVTRVPTVWTEWPP